jgi:hypothetical protein
MMNGEVAESGKGSSLLSCTTITVAWVQIPPSPPLIQKAARKVRSAAPRNPMFARRPADVRDFHAASAARVRPTTRMIRNYGEMAESGLTHPLGKWAEPEIPALAGSNPALTAYIIQAPRLSG